jgi:Domain of unknown function (DUF4252)
MSHPHRHRPQTLLPTLLLLTACSGFANPDAVSEHVSRITGTAYSRQGGLTIGKNAVRLSRVGVAAAGAKSPDLLERLDSLGVGVYGTVEQGERSRTLAPHDFRRYETVLELDTNAGEKILLLSRSSRGKIRELLAVIDGRDQLTVVQIRGDMEDILEQAVRMAFSRAERNDLTAPVLDSLSAQSPP